MCLAPDMQFDLMDILTCSVGIPSAVWAFPATSGNAHVTPQQWGNSQPLLGMPMSRLSSRGIPSHHWECPCHASAVWEFPATTGNAHVTPQQWGNSQPPLGMPMSRLRNGGIPNHHWECPCHTLSNGGIPSHNSQWPLLPYMEGVVFPIP
ncbi:hypothetical protein B0H14DRAFT_2595776 [Mycena olivaceomarginata]|nr:hypothetical protein B0H14DRAFT_2595776 [Mycena olivaceomarginata]